MRLGPLRHTYTEAAVNAGAHLHSEDDFRNACKERWSSERKKGLPRIHQIGAVGLWTFEFGGGDPDSRMMTRFLLDMYETGIVIDPDYIIDPILMPRDFLREDKSYDAVAIAYLPRTPQAYTAGEFKVFRGGNPQPSETFTLVSSRHSPQAFRQRIKETGANIVMVSGGSNEINTYCLERQDLKTVISSPVAETSRAYGYLAKTSMIEAYRPLLNKTTTSLGQAIVSCKTKGWFDAVVDHMLDSAFPEPALIDLR